MTLVHAGQLSKDILAHGDDVTNGAVVATGTQASGASGVQSGPAASASAPAAMPERFIATPVSSHEWGRAVAAEIHVLAGNGVKEATLRLSPEHLGPVEVHIDVQDTKVNVNFTATHAETRAALEQSVPQLRDMLAGSGLSLGQANVQQETRPGSHNLTPRTPQSPLAEPEEQPVMTALGLVDEYA
jgi:flagellar hook-length control protein FliK